MYAFAFFRIAMGMHSDLHIEITDTEHRALLNGTDPWLALPKQRHRGEPTTRDDFHKYRDCIHLITIGDDACAPDLEELPAVWSIELPDPRPDAEIVSLADFRRRKA